MGLVDTTAVTATQQRFAGAVFDGRYVYLVAGGSPGSSTIIPRYDTHGPCEHPQSWSAFDTAAVLSGPRADNGCYNGAVFDGHNVYFLGSSIVRYDSATAFTGVSAWSAFDLRALGLAYEGAPGGAYDGRYVYLQTQDPHGSVYPTRYDTSRHFAETASWSKGAAFGQSLDYFGAAFDGAYVYLMPGDPAPATRFDTSGVFATTSSWSTFALSALRLTATSFCGATFDGRHVYLVPRVAPPYVTRYDTTVAFGVASSWSTFDTSTLDGAPTNFSGAVFDGRFVYLYGGKRVVRFDAKTPPAMPSLPAWNGSFY